MRRKQEPKVIGTQSEKALPLWNAMVAWCDPALVRDLLAAEEEMDKLRSIEARRPLPGLERSFAVLSKVSRELAATGVQERHRGALAKIETDFRSRYMAAAFELTGLRVRPTVSAGRITLSPHWVEHFQIDWKSNRIVVFGDKFIEIEAHLLDGGCVRGAARGPVDAPPKKRSRGRPMVELDLFVSVAQGRLEQRLPTNKAEAEALLAGFRRQYPAAKPPAVRSVRDHVEEIYRRAAFGASPEKPAK